MERRSHRAEANAKRGLAGAGRSADGRGRAAGKTIPKRGYRVLAIVWTMAAAAMAVAVVRRLPDLRISTLCLLAVSILAAAFFWKTYHRTQEGGVGLDPFPDPPKFADDPVLFDDDPNQDPEEKDHE